MTVPLSGVTEMSTTQTTLISAALIASAIFAHGYLTRREPVQPLVVNLPRYQFLSPSEQAARHIVRTDMQTGEAIRCDIDSSPGGERVFYNCPPEKSK